MNQKSNLQRIMGVMSLPNSSCILQRMRMKYPVLLLQLVCILVIRGVQLLQLRLVGIRTRVRGAQLLCIICVIDYNKHNNIMILEYHNIMHTTYIHNIYEYYHRVVLLAIMDIYAYYQYQSSMRTHQVAMDSTRVQSVNLAKVKVCETYCTRACIPWYV